MEYQRMRAGKLNARQEQFVQELAKGTTQRQAYLLAYPGAKKWKPETVDKRASRLAGSSQVCGRLEEIQREIERKNSVTREAVIKQLKTLGFAEILPKYVRASDKLKALEILVRILGYDKQPAEDFAEGNQEEFLTSLTADQIAGSFTDAYRDILEHRHTEYVFHGGRGSTKSSFTSLIFIMLLENNPKWHGLALRQVGNTLRDSVYSQLAWAITELGHEDQYKFTTSPMEIEHKKTGQKVYFRGADSPLKIKSIKPPFGAIGLLWFEELDAFHGESAVRSIEQSAIRGTDTAYIFKTFNPPPTVQSWANKFIHIPKETRYVHKSDYLSVPKEWLGQVFLEEAAHLKEINPQAYEHEYLGIPNQTGGLIFPNLIQREISDEEISSFAYVYQGLDWGFAVDPVEWGKCAFDARKRVLYLFDEFRAIGMGNRELFEELTQHKGVKPNDLIIADNAEPKSIADLNSYGLTVRGTEKFPDSVRYSIKWLQSLNAIIVDPRRCPYTAREFSEYEYPHTKDGEFVSQYPDKNNHSIDRTRYATTMLWRKAGN